MAKQYIDEINRFYEFVRINGLTTSEIALFLGLLQINNRCMWAEWFTVATSELEVISGIKADNIYKLRNKLKQWGLIDIQIQGGRKSSKYKICNYDTPNFPNKFQTNSNLIPNKLQTSSKQFTTLIDKDIDKDILSSSNARAREIYHAYEENIGVLTGMVVDELDGFIELLCPEAVMYAIRQAVMNNKKSCGYVKGVCKSLLNSGITTPVDLERHIKEREEQVQARKDAGTSSAKINKEYIKSEKSYSDRDLFPDVFE